MDENLQFVMEKRLERVAKALERNNMKAYIVQEASQVVPLIKTIIEPGASIANGGSMTLVACGVMDLLKSGEYKYLDRAAPDVDKQKIQREAFFSDYYFASANAITETGEIFEMDGYANRVAAIAYGPQNVILVVGRNKVVADLEGARKRNREISGPTNARRVGSSAPCTKTGQCVDCKMPGHICSTELVLHYQIVKDRIKVILVNEDLGY